MLKCLGIHYVRDYKGYPKDKVVFVVSHMLVVMREASWGVTCRVYMDTRKIKLWHDRGTESWSITILICLAANTVMKTCPLLVHMLRLDGWLSLIYEQWIWRQCFATRVIWREPWLFWVGGAICLVNSANDRDSSLLNTALIFVVWVATS